jgi:hypothetical protein
LFSWAAEPPISTIVQPVPAVLANEAASGGGAGAGGGEVLGAGLLPQPATATAADSTPAAASLAGRRHVNVRLGALWPAHRYIHGRLGALMTTS